jgi:hypothetical protein
MFSLLIVLPLVVADLSAYFWQAKNTACPDYQDFPEDNYLKSRPSTAIGFTGKFTILK